MGIVYPAFDAEPKTAGRVQLCGLVPRPAPRRRDVERGAHVGTRATGENVAQALDTTLRHIGPADKMKAAVDKVYLPEFFLKAAD